MKTSFNLLVLAVLIAATTYSAAAQSLASLDFVPPVLTEKPKKQSTAADKKDRMEACFNGGVAKMSRYLQSAVKDPALAQDNSVEGTVVVAFHGEADGSVTKPVIVKPLGFGCDEAALKAIADMPAWTPAIREGKPVATRVQTAINFSLR